MKRFKKDYGTVRKIFPSTPRLFQREQICRHGNRKGRPISSYKQFIKNLNNYLKNDLPNPLSYIKL